MPTYNKNYLNRVTFCIGSVKTACHLPSYPNGDTAAFEAVRTDSLDPNNIGSTDREDYVTDEGQ